MIILYILAIIIVLLYYKTILLFFLFNDFYIPPNRVAFVNTAYSHNNFYKRKYASFFKQYENCTIDNYDSLPYLTKDDLIKHNDELITPPYKKCELRCTTTCLHDPLWLDSNCTIGQSTGGTSGKSTFVWMNKYDAYIYICTFMHSFRKNGYQYGDRLLVFYPADSYFTNEYAQSNFYLNYINIQFLTFTHIDKEKTIEFVNILNTTRPEFIVIFPFVLLKLCLNIIRYNLELTHHPRNINLSGEYLLNCSLHFCKSIFQNSNIENTYGAVEFGEIAHQVKDDKNTFEVFNQYCYLENREDKIVVTSFINPTFPIIRYIMEDVGTIVNKNGRQYITNLIGKNTNQIRIDNTQFSSLDVDRLIDSVNIDNKIVSIVMKYDINSIDIHYIVHIMYNNDDKDVITKNTQNFLNQYFTQVNYKVVFTEDYTHDYLKKFKIIIKKDNTDNEPVGGYFKYK